VKKTTKWLLIIGGAIFLIVLAARPTPEPQVREVIREVEVTKKQTEQDEFYDSMEGYYMDGCYDGTNRNYCQCTYDYMVNNYGLEALLDASIELDETGEYPYILNQAISACMHIDN